LALLFTIAISKAVSKHPRIGILPGVRVFRIFPHWLLKKSRKRPVFGPSFDDIRGRLPFSPEDERGVVKRIIAGNVAAVVAQKLPAVHTPVPGLTMRPAGIVLASRVGKLYEDGIA
jgi:hypothetical protein